MGRSNKTEESSGWPSTFGKAEKNTGVQHDSLSGGHEEAGPRWKVGSVRLQQEAGEGDEAGHLLHLHASDGKGARARGGRSPAGPGGRSPG